MRRALPLVLTLLAACPDAPIAPPDPPVVEAPAAVTAWVSCAAELGFDGDLGRVLPPDGAEVALRPPAVIPGDTPEVLALRWLTPRHDATWRLLLRVDSGGALVLEDLAPGAFLDAQRLLVLERRCGPLRVGEVLAGAYATGPAQAATTRGAARLVAAACSAGPDCPVGWRERLLDLAAVHPDAAPPRFPDRCGVVPPPASELSTARDLRAWVLEEVGPAPDQSVVAWARALRDRALGSGEDVVRSGFEAHRAAGKLAAAARLVDEATAANLGLSERLRFDGALAWRDAGEPETAAERLTALADEGRTVYADFARRALAELRR